MCFLSENHDNLLLFQVYYTTGCRILGYKSAVTSRNYQKYEELGRGAAFFLYSLFVWL
jgi:hypothetical protein